MSRVAGKAPAKSAFGTDPPARIEVRAAPRFVHIGRVAINKLIAGEGIRTEKGRAVALLKLQVRRASPERAMSAASSLNRAITAGVEVEANIEQGRALLAHDGPAA